MIRFNRVGVEHVMGFCTKEQYEGFLEHAPKVEWYMTKSGIILIKYWLEVGNEEQERRFEARVEDPLRQWKLSPMDLPSRERWYDYSRARDRMLEATDSKHAPWYLVRSDDKKRARLNVMTHLLSLIPYEKQPREKIKIPKRSNKGKYDAEATLKGKLFIPDSHWPPPEDLLREDYLKKQGRFAHLFQPQRNEALIAEIQARVDAYWAEVERAS